MLPLLSMRVSTPRTVLTRVSRMSLALPALRASSLTSGREVEEREVAAVLWLLEIVLMLPLGLSVPLVGLLTELSLFVFEFEELKLKFSRLGRPC